jgi:hypothetical protein
MAEISHYIIINKKTGAQVDKATTLKGARKSVDRNDNSYGGYIHTFKPIYIQEKSELRNGNPFDKAKKTMKG